MSFLVGLKLWLPFLVLSIIAVVVPIVLGVSYIIIVICYSILFLLLTFGATIQGILVNYGYFTAYVETDRRLDGHCAIVTGANSGIGYETAKELVRRGCNVIITARSQAKVDKTIAMINKELGITDTSGDDNNNSNNNTGTIDYLILDLSSKESIDNAINSIINDKSSKYNINILINNAGAWLSSPFITKDGGIDAQWQANYFAPFYMTKKILPCIEKACKALNYGRIINVTSSEHRRATVAVFDGFLSSESRSDLKFWKDQATLDVYGNTKCAQIMHASMLQEIVDSEEKNELCCMSAHPGFVDSGFVGSNERAVIIRWLYPYLVHPFFYTFGMLNSKQGSQTTLHCVLEEKENGKIKPGGFHAHCQIKKTNVNVTRNVIKPKREELFKVSSGIWE